MQVRQRIINAMYPGVTPSLPLLFNLFQWLMSSGDRNWPLDERVDRMIGLGEACLAKSLALLRLSWDWLDWLDHPI